MKSDWEKRYREAENVFHELKSYTKRIKLDNQTPEYKELVNLIHTAGRNVFYVNQDDYVVEQ